MMDMGFWPQLREIQEKLPQKKQQLLFIWKIKLNAVDMP
jgi:superfamily II DNA/RNA helicase